MILLRLLALPLVVAVHLLIGLVAVVIWSVDRAWDMVRTGDWPWRP